MIYETTENFYTQKIYLTNVRESRFEFLANLCKGKSVMHIGCADTMVFNPDTNLHIYLSAIGEGTIIDGLDIDVETSKKLEEVCPGTYFTAYDAVNKSYDLMIIPEVIEHVPNIGLFLKDIFSIKCEEYFFTAPSMMMAQFFCEDTFSLESVHPDHKCWFSPYTLYNTIKPFANELYIQMYYLENKSQIGMRLFKKKVLELLPQSEQSDQSQKEKKEEDNFIDIESIIDFDLGEQSKFIPIELVNEPEFIEEIVLNEELQEDKTEEIKTVNIEEDKTEEVKIDIVAE
tara:strand:- start:23434 stop:24294 length:861 start_codon:yes stop_codon:yes gene_type:complete